MNSRTNQFIAACSLALVALLVTAPPAGAQAQRSGGGASAQMAQQYQQLASERTALQAENAKLKQELADMTGQRDAMKKERDALHAKSGSADAATAQVAEAKRAAEQAAEQQRKKMDELIGRYRDTATTLQGVEKQRADLETSLARRSEELGECSERNVKLADITNEVVARYEHQGWFHGATIDEPFTRITRTRVENLADADRARVAALKVVTPASAGATPQR